jgi:hypothetical protein
MDDKTPVSVSPRISSARLPEGCTASDCCAALSSFLPEDRDESGPDLQEKKTNAKKNIIKRRFQLFKTTIYYPKTIKFPE